MFDGCFSWNSCYTYVGGKKSSSNPSQVECLFDEAGPSQQIKGFGIFAGWKNGLWQFTTWTHKSDDPACQWLRWHSESPGSPSLALGSLSSTVWRICDGICHGPWVWICCLSTWGAKKLRLERLKDWWPNSCWHCKICQSSPGFCAILIWCLILLYLLLSVQLLLSWSVKVVTVCCRMLVELVPVVVVLLAKVENRV